MVNTTTTKHHRTIASISFAGLQFGTRKAYLREETQSERIWREEKIFKYAPKHCFRLSMTFEDHSTKYFSIYADNKTEAIDHATVAVQEFVDSFDLQRVVWQVEGGPIHLTSAKAKVVKMPIKSKWKAWKNKINDALEKFFFLDDLEDIK